MKTLIKQLLREGLDEAEYNYHVGQLDDNPEPYGSDNIVMMKGRGTGHFGSGVYFSTYTCDIEEDFDKKYGEHGSKGLVKNPNLMNVNANLYRVDFDIYQNLYRVTSTNHAEILFKTLKFINETFYGFSRDYQDTKQIPADLSNKYILIKNNLNQLKLECPKYKDFIKMLLSAHNDYTAKRDNKKNDYLPSFSTRIMEYNGYNGVNVSNVKGYDNTLHGSVIYDMSKIDGQPKPVKNISMFCKIKNNAAAGEDYSGNKVEDLKYKLLSGEGDLNEEDFRLINDLDQKTQLMIMKRYNKFINSFYINSMNDYTKSIYFKTLPNKMKSGVIDEIPDKDIIKSIIDNGYVNIIYDPAILIEESTFLNYVLNILWKFDDNIINTILNNIPRQLNPEEQEALKTYHEEWG